MSDWNDSFLEELSEDQQAINNDIELDPITIDLSLSPMSFLEAMSHFSDIVSKTADPFNARLNSLLILGSKYLGATRAVFAKKQQDVFVIEAEISNYENSDLFISPQLPLVQLIQDTDEPLDTKLGRSDKVIGPSAARCLASPVRIDGDFQAFALFVCEEAESEQELHEQQLFIKMFSRFIGNEAIRSNVKAALTYRIEFEQLLSDISRGFIHVEKDTIDTAISDALRRIAEFASVDTSYIMMFCPEKQNIKITHWWKADEKGIGVPLDHASVELFPWSLGKVLNGEVVVMSDVMDFPLEAVSERKFMASQNMKTAILAPLVFGGSVQGLVGFASTQQRIHADNDKMQLLQMVGQTLASAVELKQTQEQVIMLEDQMRHTQKLESLGVLAGGIAHDFNNLLMGVLGNAGIALSDDSISDESRVAIERVEKIATHAGDLTNQLLAYSGRGKFIVESVNLSDIAENMQELLTTVISKKHKLSTNFAQDLPRVEVDIAQISQVVMNLITNASEAIGEDRGKITLSTGLISVNKDSLYESYYSNNTPDGAYVYLRVRDSGCGMDEDTRSKIFDPFYSTKFTGRGLGLAAVLGIVRGHGGTVRVESEVGQGTTFTILLPCSKVEEILTGASEQIVECVRRDDQANALNGKSVLVVDDEESIRTVIRSILERKGCHVLSAANGAEAIRIYEENSTTIDICLIDMTMPDLSGYEVAQRFRECNRRASIILTSGYSEQEVRKHCESLQDLVFLQKPFHPKRLIEQLLKLAS